MRIATYLTTLAASLALSACGGGDEPADTKASTMADAPAAESKAMPGNAAVQSVLTASGDGTVTAIDPDAGTITIDHGAIAAVDWPAMTMAFEADEAQRQSVTVGDQVTFDFRTTEGGAEITRIERR